MPAFARDGDLSGCLATVAENLQTRLDAQVLKFGDVKPGTEPVLLEGSNSEHAVLLLHGYIASPFEVRALAESLHDRGLTVVVPLLPGFGGTSEAANQAHWQDWVESARAAYADLAACYPRVSLAGFSLGAAVAAYLAVKDENVRTTLHSLTLLSPAIRIKNRFWLDLVFPLGFLFDHRVGVRTTANLGGKLGNHDLDVPRDYSQYYNRELPLKAARQLKILGRQIDFADFGKLEGIPTTLVFSGDDRTVNAKLAWRKIRSALPNAQSFEIPSTDHVRHQILIRDHNSRFEDIVRFASDSITIP